MTEPINTTSPPDAVLRVGKGRGFVVNCRNYLGRFDPVIITAAPVPRRRVRSARASGAGAHAAQCARSVDP